MESAKGSKAELDAKRVELIRDLCAGEGATSTKFAERFEDFRAVFGDYDMELLGNLFEAAVDAMPKSQFKAALLNAWESRDDMNLSERRMDYAEQHGSISTRTLIRHEQEGAELLVKYFDLVEAQYLREQEEAASDDAARDADMEVLRRRLKKLEVAVLEKGALVERVDLLQRQLKFTTATLTKLVEKLQAAGVTDFTVPVEGWPSSLDMDSVFEDTLREILGPKGAKPLDLSEWDKSN